MALTLHLAASSSSAAPASRPALIVSSTARRFRRAERAVAELNFSATWLRSVFIDDGHPCYFRRRRAPNAPSAYPPAAPAAEGHRLAMRSAWAAIVAAGVPMAVFEDDVVVQQREGLADFLAHCARQRCEMAFLGEIPHFFTDHAK